MPKNITIQKLLGVLLRRLPFILMAGVLMAAIFFVYTSLAIKPVYSTSAMIYIQNFGKQQKTSDDPEATVPATTVPNATDSSKQGANTGKNESLQSNNEVAQKIFNSDLSGSAALASSCVILFQNDPIVTQQYKGCKVNMSTKEFYVTISVSGTDPEKCKTVANNVVKACSDVFYQRFPYGNVGEIRPATKPGKPISPNKVQNSIVGGAIGIVLACIVAILLELIDTTIKRDDDLTSMYKIPVFAEIPDFEGLGR